jgi:NAD(P)-dependent dehydrogenase (short-subunit alcohol dehydrogenase family)
MKISKFKDAVVIITGAASGMGQEMAVQAAQRGGFVIATDVNEKGLKETQAMAQKVGCSITIQRLDVANKVEIKDFAEKTLPTLKNRLLILINNAGIGLTAGKFQDNHLDDFENLININLWGIIRMTKAFYPYFIEQNQGSIVNLSSVFGLGGVMFQSAYCTAKAGVKGFTESLRMELLETNIKTLVVHPGGIKTNIARNAPPKSSVITAAKYEEAIKAFDKNAPTTSEQAAKQILDAVEKNKERLVIGIDGKILSTMTRLFPVGFTRMMKGKMEEVMTNPYKKKDS